MDVLINYFIFAGKVCFAFNHTLVATGFLVLFYGWFNKNTRYLLLFYPNAINT